MEDKVKDFIVDELDLRREGAVLETGRPYLVPLAETLALPAVRQGQSQPEELDGQARRLHPGHHRLQLPLRRSRPRLPGPAVRRGRAAVVRRAGPPGPGPQPAPPYGGPYRPGRRRAAGPAPAWTRSFTSTAGRPSDAELATSGGLFLSLDLGSTRGKRVGYRAREHTLALDMAKPGAHRTEDYWEEVLAEEEGRVVLGPERFYLLLSREAVRVPPGLACEMTAYDPTSGELRTHYAGFFDPGFGYDPAGKLNGSRAALEVRAHDVPFMIEHGQQVCRLTFERMICEPAKLYGRDIGSNYQGQVDTLGKHFRRPRLSPLSARWPCWTR